MTKSRQDFHRNAKEIAQKIASERQKYLKLEQIRSFSATGAARNLPKNSKNQFLTSRKLGNFGSLFGPRLFCNISPFSLTHSRPDFLWLFSDFDLSGFAYPPKIDSWPFSKCLPIYLIFHTPLLSFKLKFCNYQSFVFVQTFSILLESLLNINLTYLTVEIYN